MSNHDPNLPPNSNDPHGAGASGAVPPPPSQPQQGQPGQQPPYGQPQQGQPGQQPPYGQPQQPHGRPQQPYSQPGQRAPGGDIDVMEAFKYGWKKFTANLGVVLGGVVAYIVAIVIILVIFVAILGAVVSTGSGAAATLGFLGTMLVVAFAMVLALFMQAAIINVALMISRGRKVTFGSFFQLPNMGKVLLTALIIGVASGLGAFVFVGPIIVGFFGQFALLYAIDKGLDPIDAIKASIDLVLKNLTPTILLFVGSYVVYAIGGAVCGLGLVVAVPVAALATSYMYLRLKGETAAV